MQPRHTAKIATLLLAAGTFAAAALAQDRPAQPNQPAIVPNPSTQATAQTEPGQGPRMGRGDGGGMMMGGGMGRRMQGISETDRAAFFEARLASIKAGLMLTEPQLRLWPAVESNFRDMRKLRIDLNERIGKEGQPANPVDRMKRTGEIMSARGAAMTKMAEAMKPFHDSLTDDQKRRLQILMRPAGGRRSGMMNSPQGGFGPQGGQAGGWRQHHERRPGPQGEGRRWRQDAPGDGFGSGGNRSDWRRM